MYKDNKLTVISEAFAPQVVGSPILLANLLSEYPGPISAIAGWQSGTRVDPDFQPPCYTEYVKMPGKALQRLHDRFKLKFVKFDKWRIKQLLNKHQPDVALVVCPGGEFFVAGSLACQELGIPYMVHMHDLWADNLQSDSPRRGFADKWEPRLLKQAKTVFAMTEVQKYHLDAKYGLNCEILPHTIPDTRLAKKMPFDRGKVTLVEKTIVYTGNVSKKMNLDAVQQFVNAVEKLPSEYKIKMFIPWNKTERLRNRVDSNRVDYNWLSREEVFKEVQKANAVFLPLSFKNAAMEEVRTVYATKTLDYLLSGAPILVYAPEDSFHATSALKNSWGEVVSQEGPEHILKAILTITQDANRSAQIVEHAHHEAIRRSSSFYAKKLAKWVTQL